MPSRAWLVRRCFRCVSLRKRASSLAPFDAACNGASNAPARGLHRRIRHRAASTLISSLRPRVGTRWTRKSTLLPRFFLERERKAGKDAGRYETGLAVIA